MNEKQEYASMLEIPVNTATVTSKPIKKKRGRKPKAVEEVKKELLDKVNAETFEEQNVVEQSQAEDGVETEQFNELSQEISEEPIKKAKKKTVAFSIVTVQLIVIGALIASIFLTNAFYPNSAINSLINGTYKDNSVVAEDDRIYSDFKPVLALGNEETVLVSDGVMTISSVGSVYAPCSGKISSVTLDGNGKYTLEISHSDNFTSKISGLDYAYAEKGDSVFGTIPVGYVKDQGLTMCFTGVNGEVITDYQVTGNSVVWSV